MKPFIRMGAAGFSNPIPISYQGNTFGVGLSGIPSSNANLTWAVQHTFDDTGPDGDRDILVSQAVNTVTVTDLRTVNGVQGHGLSVADSVNIRGVPGLADGTRQVVSITSQTVYTFTDTVSQTLTGAAGFARNLRWLTHVFLTALTTRQDGNYAFPIRAVRLSVTSYVAGYIDLLVLQPSSR